MGSCWGRLRLVTCAAWALVLGPPPILVALRPMYLLVGAPSSPASSVGRVTEKAQERRSQSWCSHGQEFSRPAQAPQQPSGHVLWPDTPTVHAVRSSVQDSGSTQRGRTFLIFTLCLPPGTGFSFSRHLSAAGPSPAPSVHTTCHPSWCLHCLSPPRKCPGPGPGFFPACPPQGARHRADTWGNTEAELNRTDLGKGQTMGLRGDSGLDRLGPGHVWRGQFLSQRALEAGAMSGQRMGTRET